MGKHDTVKAQPLPRTESVYSTFSKKHHFEEPNFDNNNNLNPEPKPNTQLNRQPSYLQKQVSCCKTIKCPNISVHGISHARENSGKPKVQAFWILIFVLGFGGMVYFIQGRLTDYLNSGVSTSFQFDYPKYLPFPATTICSLNSWDDTEIKVMGAILKEKIEIEIDAVKGTFDFKIAVVDYLWTRLDFYKENFLSGRGSYLEQHWHFVHYFSERQDDIIVNFDTLLKTYQIYNDKCAIMTPEVREIIVRDSIKTHCNRPELTAMEQVFSYYTSVMNVTCERFHNNMTDTISNDELCKLRWLGPMVDNLYGILVGDAEMSRRLASEIFMDFSLLSDVDHLYNSYSYKNSTMITFIDSIKWDHMTDIWLKFLPSSSPQTTTWGFITSHYGIDFFQDLDFKTVGFLYSSLYRGMMEIAQKTGWGVDVTNLDVTDVNTPKEFNLGWGMMKWWFTGSRDLNETLSVNHTISMLSTVFGEGYGMGLQPLNNVIQVSFAGKILRQDDVFEPAFTLLSASCLRLKKSFLKTASQTNPGATAGLRVILFAGSTDLGQIDSYANLEKKPAISVLVDHSSAHIPGVSRSPISVATGMKSTIMLRAESYERVSQDLRGTCDPSQTLDTVTECVVDCVLNKIVLGACGCHPAAADFFKIPVYNHSDPAIRNSPECRFEDFQNEECFNATQQGKKGEFDCNCGQPCTENGFGISYSVGDHGINLGKDDILFAKDWRKYMFVQPDDFMQSYMETIALPDRTREYFEKVVRGYSMVKGLKGTDVSSDKQLWSRSIAVVDIGFESLQIKRTIESVADQASSLVSDLGGQLGLWLGLSMVSILEVLYCFGYYCHKIRKCSEV